MNNFVSYCVQAPPKVIKTCTDSSCQSLRTRLVMSFVRGWMYELSILVWAIRQLGSYTRRYSKKDRGRDCRSIMTFYPAGWITFWPVNLADNRVVIHRQVCINLFNDIDPFLSAIRVCFLRRKSENRNFVPVSNVTFFLRFIISFASINTTFSTHSLQFISFEYLPYIYLYESDSLFLH